VQGCLVVSRDAVRRERRVNGGCLSEHMVPESGLALPFPSTIPVILRHLSHHFLTTPVPRPLRRAKQGVKLVGCSRPMVDSSVPVLWYRECPRSLINRCPITSNIFVVGPLTPSPRTSIKLRSEYLSWNTPPPPPPSFDLTVIPVSLSSCKWSCLPQVRPRANVDAALLYTSYRAEENELGHCFLSQLPLFTMSYTSEQTTLVSRSVSILLRNVHC
jgi:hypothetical protein